MKLVRFKEKEKGKGHGTHVSGTIAGKWTGVCPSARIAMFRIFNSAGTTSPSVNDAIRVEATSTGFILHRTAGGTSGLTYNWFRMK